MCTIFVMATPHNSVKNIFCPTALHNRKALVGGASKGLGQAISHALAAAGASVHGLARDKETLAAAMEALPGSGHCATAIDFDHSEALTGLVSENDHYDIFIHNTGGPAAGPLLEADPDDLDAAFRRHVRSAHLLMQQVVPGMRDRGFGRIVLVVSTSVITPIRGLGVSNTIRNAIANWARTLAVELASDGITVNCVLPGFTDTDRLTSLISGRANRQNCSTKEVRDAMIASVPAGRLGNPGELAALTTFLCSEAAGYINGTVIPVDGGRVVAG